MATKSRRRTLEAGRREADGDRAFVDFGDPVGNVAYSMDYSAALARTKATLTPLQKDLLSVLVAAKGELSGAEVARLVGLGHHAGVNSAIVTLAKRLTQAVGVDPPKRRDGTPRWWHVVADGRQAERGGPFYWRLRPALRVAAIAAGFGALDERWFADERETPLLEGSSKVVRVNAYERNPLARRRCIEHHGLACAVCGLLLASVYGPVAQGVIHVHHLRPLSGRRAEHAVDPVADLRPVCPNCHVVLHLRQPPFSIGELRSVMQQQREAAGRP